MVFNGLFISNALRYVAKLIVYFMITGAFVRFQDCINIKSLWTTISSNVCISMEKFSFNHEINWWKFDKNHHGRLNWSNWVSGTYMNIVEAMTVHRTVDIYFSMHNWKYLKTLLPTKRVSSNITKQMHCELTHNCFVN